MNFIQNESADKLRGGYYTDAGIAEYLVRWVSAINPRAILEPSCGDGAFFRAIGQCGLSNLKVLVGCETEASEASKAASAAAQLAGVDTRVEVGDFLAWVKNRLESPGQFDAVVGNPPFIRYQYLDPAVQQRSEEIIRRFGLRFTKHTNAWVPFVIASLSQLRAGGRLAMVVPAELLHVLHSASVRQYLLQECSRILVLDPEELWFEGALQGVVLLLAEKWSSKSRISRVGKVAITRIAGRGFLSGSPEEHFERAEYINGASVPAKWMLALLSSRERSLVADLAALQDVYQFGDIAKVQVGIVTGANAFFLVSDDVVDAYDLWRYARPMFGRSDHVAGVVYDEASHSENRRRGVPTNFLLFDSSPRSSLPKGAARYVEFGESQGLHKRFKCRIREPWYAVPSVYSAPVGMLKRSHDYPRLVLNAAGAYTTDTAYRITALSVPQEQFVYSFVNSLTALSAELEGRHYGGGVLELVPSEISRLRIPISGDGYHRLGELDSLCRGGAGPEVVLSRQDAVVLRRLGLGSAEIADIQAAWWKLRNRRQRATGSRDVSMEDVADADFMEVGNLC